MKSKSSSFKFLVSSFALLLAFGGTADAQWIIDGQQVQTLNLNVSDPQALYADGSREITGTLPFNSDLTATSGWFRANLPWDGEHSFFLTDEDEEVLNFSSSGNVGLQIGRMIVRDTGLYQLDEGTRVDLGEHMLSGGWQLDQVLPYDEALINRGFADARYLRADTDLTAPLAFSSALTATSGVLRAFIPWNGQTADLLVLDGDNECLKLSSSANVALQIGGVTAGQSGISGYGVSVGFEDNTLFGPWKLYEVTDNSKALLNRSYADARYLRTDIDAHQSIKFDQSLTATNGALQIYATDNAEHLGYFKSLSFQDGLQFSTAHSAALFFGQNSSDGLLIGPDTIMQLGYNTRIEFETGLLTGSGGAKWHVAVDPTEDSGIVSKGYADGRYLQRTEGITTNHTIQAGDVLQIQNGLITAINP